ncbi:MAG: hypothetical protein WCI11_10150 [Candidatus Methylumidiphilus sp.]
MKNCAIGYQTELGIAILRPATILRKDAYRGIVSDIGFTGVVKAGFRPF